MSRYLTQPPPRWDWSEFLSSTFWGGVLLVLCGIAGALFGAMTAHTSEMEVIGKRDALEAQCIAGNENACRVYEVRWGHK